MNGQLRLTEERVRLGLTQEEMADAGGVKKRAYCYYESGERQPDMAFLAGIAAVGADVQYILTGKRSSSVPALETAEWLLLENYRRCGPQAQANLLQTSSLLAAGLPASSEDQSKTKEARQVFHGNVGQVMRVEGDSGPVKISFGEKKNG